LPLLYIPLFFFLSLFILQNFKFFLHLDQTTVLCCYLFVRVAMSIVYISAVYQFLECSDS
jgi:hypothetical protein